ncbi:MAG: hypothetical protein K0U41_10065 [Gammaproteobacteria bacterium]|nr:hypothetical protein [Gammaproteobacteria bacterium]
MEEEIDDIHYALRSNLKMDLANQLALSQRLDALQVQWCIEKGIKQL